ncbi:hypothetical protein GCM10023212_06130 [Luteolibacter yonseiensis]
MTTTDILARFRSALATESFVAFIRALDGFGLEFDVRGKNPRIRECQAAKSHRLRTLGGLPEFLKRLSQWDHFEYGLDLTSDDCALLTIRLHWIAGTSFNEDISPDNFSGLSYFTHKLGLPVVKDAMTTAQRKIDSAHLDDRYRYFCGICHNKIRDNGPSVNGLDPAQN